MDKKETLKRQRRLFEFDIPTTTNLLPKNAPVVVLLDSDDDGDDIEIQEQIICPFCNLNISLLQLHERETHCDTCSAQPLINEKPVNNLKRKVISLTDYIESDPSEPPRKRTPRPRSTLPPFKKLFFGNITIVVDGFNFADDSTISQYFLSHFHSDHYIGLKKSWCQGKVYCSEITANLLIQKFKLGQDRIVVLPMDTPVWIHPTVQVICYNANHCPGAVVFLFQEFDNDRIVKRILHTGDFRSNDNLIEQINQETRPHTIDQIYLDTTYLFPGYNFPLQESVLQVTAQFAYDLYTQGTNKIFNNKQPSIFNFLRKSYNASRCLYKYLFVIGTYSIGKEKLAIAIAMKLKSKIFIPKETRKHQIIKNYLTECFPPDIITHDITQSCVHLASLSTLSSPQSIENYFKPVSHIYQEFIGFSPTGWSFNSRAKYASSQGRSDWLGYHSLEEKINICDTLLRDCDIDVMRRESVLRQYNPDSKYQVFKVPYSEHSSFKDLAKFGTSISWGDMIPTVNLHKDGKVKDMEQWFESWKKLQQKMVQS